MSEEEQKRVQKEWEDEQARINRRKWLGPSRKNKKDIPKHSEILCIQCGYIWKKTEDEQVVCPKCRR